ncbi:MAG: hypothetical protein ACLRR3_03010 [Eubacterium sp.]
MTNRNRRLIINLTGNSGYGYSRYSGDVLTGIVCSFAWYKGIEFE